MTVLVDTNVLIDLLEEDPQWFEWSKAKIEFHGRNDTLAINQLVLAEVSVEFTSEEALNSALPPHFFRRLDLPWSAAFIAGRRFLEYRRAAAPGSFRCPILYWRPRNGQRFRTSNAGLRLLQNRFSRDPLDLTLAAPVQHLVFGFSGHSP